MDDQNKNLILATVLSFLVILGWTLFFPPVEPPVDPNAPSDQVVADTPSDVVAAAPPNTGSLAEDTTATDAPRIPIETARLTGSISLQGGRIDTLSLKDYRETLDADSEIVQLLTPAGEDGAYYALYGWAPGQGLTPDDVPGKDTTWTVANGTVLSETAPVTLSWDNGKGLTFDRVISVDSDYMFTVTQSVRNAGEGSVSLAPYGMLVRQGELTGLKNFFVLHEGLIRMTDGILDSVKYSKMPDFDVDPNEGGQAEVERVQQSGWIGFTDHFWMTTLIPAADTPFKSVAKYGAVNDVYRTEAVLPTQNVAAGADYSVTTQLFAGAKEWEAIRAYQKAGVDRFVDSIDWGWFFFLTKPIFAVLHWLNGLIGNMGWAIIALTFLIKALLFPLAYKSYVSMAKMKELQPEMEKIKESAGDDRQKLQQEMMALYKKEKVNPASGCLPILLQIPIFFSLYKVIFVTLELRHAPWVGWIKDLSAPDPSSILNLFGLLPWATPEPGSLFFILSLGILPILLGISMWLQQKLNPAPTDATQAMIFAWMPWIFMFMLGSFASGLVLYWIANNTITFIQQYTIMRSQGYKPDVFGNIRSSFKKKPKPEDKG